VPISITDKPAPLTAQELVAVRKHVDNGGECLESLPSERRDLTWQIIHSHHENFDGSGYPDRASGTDIPAIARLVRIVVFSMRFSSTVPMPGDRVPTRRLP
tara:strand:+ start:875 stop:1177 length:303 start_codon:yes stop_codon:yes gene_type:complete